MRQESEQIELIFLAALRNELEKRGRGAQTELAKKTGIKPAYLNHIVRGRKCGSENTRRLIAQALGYPYEELLGQGRQLLRSVGPERQQPILPFAEELDHWPAFSRERYRLVYQKVCEELGMPGSMELGDWILNAAAGEYEEYQKGLINEYDLFQHGKRKVSRILACMQREFERG